MGKELGRLVRARSMKKKKEAKNKGRVGQLGQEEGGQQKEMREGKGCA